MRLWDVEDGVGGFSIGQHMVDMVSFRRSWLTTVSPEHAQRVPDPIDMNAPTWLVASSIEELQASFDAGDAAIREAVLDAVRDGRGFEGAYEWHPAQLMLHCIVHDAHHRGQIMALLRQAGRGDEERERLEQATWPIWRE